ncbi:hypothetical protein DPM33_13140 [Mesorhizobium hawassense]|uniref:Uncharacterized protein n=2 Tax=Mesorhizobium hawassense TaxID=1209954 RepID=A0A330HV29_9HYPH|nr:hypothetical protein DPM33_13140 [Mesorhizobium hawassense]
MMLANLSDDANKRLVALRSAMRAFPGVAEIGEGSWGLYRETELPIRLHAIRAIFVAWSEFVFDGVRSDARREAFDALAAPLAILDEGLPDFYNRNIIGSDYAVTAWQDATRAARRAVSLVEAIDTLAFQDLPFDQGRSYRDFLDTLSIYGPTGRADMARWRAAQRAAICADCALLQKDEATHAELALAPLWPDPTSAALETNLAMSLSVRNIRDLGNHIEKWLRERKDGSLVLNMGVEQARERVVRIANLPASFWESRPAAITLRALDYCLHGDLQNPKWGSES